MDYRPRALAATIRRALSTFPAVLVTGARQSGKTTLLRAEFGASHRYVSLERPDVRSGAVSDPVAFLDGLEGPAILDEIQYVPALLHYIKDRIDENRTPGRWLLTGSQSFGLMQGVSQSLAGRVAILRLDPLSTAEAVAIGPPYGTIDHLLEAVFGAGAGQPPPHPRIDLVDWLLRGGYPELRLNPEVDRQLWCSSYVQTYLERDVRDLLQVGDLSTFTRFIQLVAARTGTLLNMTEIGRELGVSGPTVKRWLSVLQASQIVILLQPYHRNFGKRIRKSPKLHMIDPALATFLLGLHDAEALTRGPSFGPLAESAVVAEWTKAFHNAGQEPDLHYWRSAAGLEVDLVIERSGNLYGLEIKATATPRPSDAESLAAWLELAGPNAYGALACRVDAPRPLRPRIRAVPWDTAWGG